ncbi:MULTISPECIES: phosphoenolpyruvate--protein phosphotransferase [Inquilinus]|uniref:Phosphoenolpyruvate-protein phosphotransferase n=1 Tax=Inquilinus ginsengisoli TaxID=363840 RepID=A0ABU1JVK4_9PROT|nr:phosphoenolpyruvate--protein phosphotransferase [Inquilinus ginsengisoli]MDR6292631.1 phosphotransferase system enzyme I (PtsI) [Inquilinus ginsengisoli]
MAMEIADIPAPAPNREVALTGLAVSGGIAIGPAHLIESGVEQVAEYRLDEADLAAERERFAEALAKARRQIKKLKAKAQGLPEQAAEDIGYLLDAHAAILSGSRLLRGVETRIAEERVNAEYAVQSEIAALAVQFAAMDDSYLASRIDDIREVGARLIRNLTKRQFQAFANLPEGSIVLAEEITPADTALMDPRRVVGFAAALGGAQSHTAIMARSLGLPAVLGVPGLLVGIRSGQMVIVDGSAGRVIIDPTPETLAAFRIRRDLQRADRKQLHALVGLPARTRDDVTITLSANIELPRDAQVATDLNAAGVGLLRTEFMFMNRDDLPTEEEQYATLSGMVDAMAGKVVTIRTLDLGGDKIAAALGGRFAEIANPALGLRAIRLSLKEPKLLEAQLAAILRAGAHGPIRVLLPMITTIGEIRTVKAALDRTMRRLRRRKVPVPAAMPPLGVMIEVPGAALIADALAREVDFFAIGTNDLVMYTLAADRGDESVAHLYDPLHTSVLRLVQFTVEAALRARIPVSVCGEIAGDPRFTALLVGLGIRDLSMAPLRLLEVKRRILTLDSVAAARRARMMLDQTDSGRIAALLDDFNEGG